MKKQPQIKEQTRHVFMDVFCKLYGQKPIEKISVKELTNKAGYNRSTFYQYFPDIYELLACVENDVLMFMQQKVESGNAGVSDIITLYEEKGKYLNALLGDYGSNRFVERLKATFPLEANYTGLQEDECIKPYLMEYHISTTLSLFRLWQRRERDLPMDELVNLIHHLYTGGLAAVKKAKH